MGLGVPTCFFSAWGVWRVCLRLAHARTGGWKLRVGGGEWRGSQLSFGVRFGWGLGFDGG